MDVASYYDDSLALDSLPITPLASLLAQVVIACQRFHFLNLPTGSFTKVFEHSSTMSFGGYPSIVSFTSMASHSFEITSWQFLPNNLKLRYKTHALLSGFESVIVDLRLDSGSTPEQSALSIWVKAAEAQLDKLHVEFCSTSSTWLEISVS
jgi:hypothetical protein